MLTVSLHGIRVVAPIGMYAIEKTEPNTFETDVDVWVRAEAGSAWPFIDYAIISGIVADAFTPDKETLEELVQQIHAAIKNAFADADKVRVCIRKLHPRLDTPAG
jgi:dihydroneopterin aldolase